MDKLNSLGGAGCKRFWNIQSNDDDDVLDLSQKKKLCLNDTTAHFSGRPVPISANIEVESTTSTHDALSNILVLKEIFSKLSYRDLMNCCQVSTLWMSVAAPIMCYYRLETTIQNYGIPCEVQVEKITGFPGVFEKFTTDFPGLTTRLSACNHKNRMFIELKVIDRPYFQPRSDIYIPFLAAHGHRIYSLNYASMSTSVGISTYSRFLSYMPNLEVLQGNELELIRGDAGERPVLHNLRTIYFGDSTNVHLWHFVLGLAPNVQRIRGFPIRFSELLTRCRNANSIKSLVGYNPQPNWDLQQFETSLRNLASHDVKLINVAAPNFYHVTVRTGGNWEETWDPRTQLARKIKVHFHSILKSSKDTIKEILIPPATYLDYYFSIPFVMSSVETLKFEDNAAFAYMNNGSPSKNSLKEEHRYFSPGTQLLTTFPNLKAIEINFEHVNKHVASFFPWDTFGPAMLGSRITKLKTSIVTSYEKLVKLFPHVTHLTIRSTVDHFQRVFPEICHGWSRLQTLIVMIDSSESFHNYLDEAKYSMDSALTGIPKDVCEKLHKSIVGYKKISEVEVAAFQQQHVSLGRLTCLRRLKFLVEEPALRCKLCSNDHLQSMITPLTVKYCFKPLRPNLEVTLKMGKVLKKY